MTEISVLIPCYDRPADLRSCLEQLSAQVGLDQIEVVVVDDATPNESVKQVALATPFVKYHRLDKNRGLIGARNFGAGCCSGEFIVNLDDDSWFEASDGILTAVERLKSDPRAGVLALNVNAAGRGLLWSVDAAPTELSTYTGCGNIYRRDAMTAAGPYVEAFYRQGEENDRCIRMLNCGYRVISAPDIIVFHNESPVHRNHRRIITYNAINYLRFELMRAPYLSLAFGLARVAAFTARRVTKIDWRLYASELTHKERPIWRFWSEWRGAVSLGAYGRWHKLASQSREMFRLRERLMHGQR